MGVRAVALAGTALGLALGACGTAGVVAPDLPSEGLPLSEQALTAGATARRVATIADYSLQEVIDVPATARVGEPIQVGVTTYGGGCIGEDTTVVIRGRTSRDGEPATIVRGVEVR